MLNLLIRLACKTRACYNLSRLFNLFGWIANAGGREETRTEPSVRIPLLNVSKPQRRPIKFNAGCWRRLHAALVIAMNWLTGCAKVGFESGGLAACPPVVAYSKTEQARAAEEIATLPEKSVVVGWLADYAVMRDQVRACAG